MKLFYKADRITMGFKKFSYLHNTNTKYFPYELPLYESVDIDTIEDFELAKKLFK